MYIYKITNTINDKFYIGMTTKTIESRFNRHIGYMKDTFDTPLYRDMNKLGIENFQIEVIDSASTLSELEYKEQFWIKKTNAITLGYNIATGGIGGDTLTYHPKLKQIGQKISKKVSLEKNPNASPIIMINILTGYIKEYDCMKMCQIENGIKDHSVISKRCRNIIKKPYKNKYTFYYK